ncbi:50S ribosomal protein L11 methyltransferase [Kaarinaea lacus]
MRYSKPFLTCAVALVISSCSQSTGFRNVIEHPGKLELIYYGYQLNNPSQYKIIANGKEFFITKSTVVPSIQSVFLLENTVINEGDEVLDIGTGAGIQAIFAAENASKVVATDLNQDAVDDTAYNAKFHNVAHIVDTRQGDLFGPVKDNEKFDVIIFNIDYPYNEKSKALWEVHERFFREVKNYMKPGATIFYQAGWLWNIPKIIEMIESNDLIINRMVMVNAFKMHRQPIVFTLQKHPNLKIKEERIKARTEG